MAVGDERGPVASFRYLILGSIAGSFMFWGRLSLLLDGLLEHGGRGSTIAKPYDSRAIAAAATLIFIALG
jgi:hypothetical protein